MPLFPRKPVNEEVVENESPTSKVLDNSRLVFHCQQAQGSPTGVISGFSNVKELYLRISECYDFEPSEVSFLCAQKAWGEAKKRLL